MELYEEKDYAVVKRSMLIRIAAAALVLLCVIALLVLFLTVWRSNLGAMISCGLGAAVFYYVLTVKVMPWVRYWMYLLDIRKGRAHEMDCRFVSMSDNERVSDGVVFHDFIVTLDDGTEEKDGEEAQEAERLLLWDADKPAPGLTAGQPIHVRAFGNYIVALEAK